jgi:hypothetical protein
VRRVLLAAAASVAFVAATTTAAAAPFNSSQDPSADQYAPGKATICHRLSKAKPFVTLSVPQAALPSYLRRGATLGPCVYGSVRPGGRVLLRTDKAKPITVLKARRLYSIVVSDPSRTENFHLYGHGVDRHTGIGFRGTVRWKISFAAGRYTYRSDRHPTLRRSLTVR